MILRPETDSARNPAREKFKDSAIARGTVDGTVAAFEQFVGDNDPSKITYRELDRRSGIPESTLRALAAGSAITVAQLLALQRHLPPHAINMITEPGGVHVIAAERATSNWFKVFASGNKFQAAISEALADGHVDHIEDAQLKKLGRIHQAEVAGAIAPT